MPSTLEVYLPVTKDSPGRLVLTFPFVQMRKLGLTEGKRLICGVSVAPGTLKAGAAEGV